MDPVPTQYTREPNSFTLDFYLQHGGYEGLRQALATTPAQVIDIVKASGLRGRGGAGFPTGMKWQFIPQDSPKPKYVVVNADEGEPGTCRDLPLMMNDPHSMIEGIIIACFAVRANLAFVYIRGEAVHAIRRVVGAVNDARARGYLGENILG